MRRDVLFLSSLLLVTAAALPAQVPDGWYVWTSFQGAKGECGIFMSHPRTTQAPIAITGLTDDIKWVPNPPLSQGGACVLRRPNDGALIVGERAPKDGSVDLHIIHLKGADVFRDQLFSVGTSANVGEIPQCALLPDGKILIAATDLGSGPLANYDTTSFNKQGIGILDPISGRLTPLTITNGQLMPGVMNGLAASKDGKTCYFGCWVATGQGDVYSLPLPSGGLATKIATVPAGLSNLWVDLDGKLLVAALSGPPNLFRVDPATSKVDTIATTTGPLNSVMVESTTGNLVLSTANAGLPARSLVWMTPAGKETVLISPDKATISGVDVNANPEAFGTGTAGPRNSYDWALTPNPDGLPLLGSAFGLTLLPSSGIASTGVYFVCHRRLAAPVDIGALKIWVDPSSFLWNGLLTPGPKQRVAMPLPNDANLTGIALYLQTIHLEGTGMAASPGVEFTIL